MWNERAHIRPFLFFASVFKVVIAQYFACAKNLMGTQLEIARWYLDKESQWINLKGQKNDSKSKLSDGFAADDQKPFSQKQTARDEW